MRSQEIARDLQQLVIDHLNDSPDAAPGGNDEASIIGSHAAGLVQGYFGGDYSADEIAQDLKTRMPDLPIEDFLMHWGLL